MHGKLTQIQGIRAIAMLGIFIMHTSVWLSDDLGAFAKIVGRLGGSGVATFFMLSGFLLAYKNRMIPTIERKDIIKAAWQKASKLYVLYLITFVVVFISVWPTSARDWLRDAITAIFTLTMTQDFVPFVGIVNGFNVPAWFLSALFGIWIIIFMFPKMVNKMLRLSVGQSVGVLIAVMLAQESWMLLSKYCIAPLLSPKVYSWTYEWIVYYNPVICFSEYSVGVLLGRLCVQKQLPVKSQNLIAGITLFSVVAYAVMLMTDRAHVSVSKMIIAECFVCAGIIAVMSPRSIGYRILSMRMLVWFGNISGYFFLIHGATNFMLRVRVVNYIPKPRLFFVSFAISILLAVCADVLYTHKKHNTISIYNENS